MVENACVVRAVITGTILTGTTPPLAPPLVVLRIAGRESNCLVLEIRGRDSFSLYCD